MEENIKDIGGLNKSGDEIYVAHGVALAGMEFGGSREAPGAVPDEATFKYFTDKGFELFRVAIKWERLQYSLNSKLNPVMIGHLWDCINFAKKYNSDCKIIIDVHNYAKFEGISLDSEPDAVTTADFCELWIKLSREFRNEPNVYGYGLMNEPAHISDEKWFEASQAAVNAIRHDGDNKMIVVSGPEWSGIHKWPLDSPPWINDPANNIMYEGHQYFDNVFGGSYRDQKADYELMNEHFGGDIHAYFTNVMQRWFDWLNKYKVKGFVGEFAVPYPAENDDGPKWNALLNTFMKLCHDNAVDTTYWAAGIGWPKHLNAIIQPRDGMDAPQMEVLTKYKSGFVKICR